MVIFESVFSQATGVVDYTAVHNKVILVKLPNWDLGLYRVRHESVKRRFNRPCESTSNLYISQQTSYCIL